MTELKQQALFGDTLKDRAFVKSVSNNQEEIIQNIIQLYCPYGIELDPTYSVGNFYNKIQKPKFKFDLEPQLPEVTQADCRHLPNEASSVKSIMFDPPFVAGIGKDGTPGIIRTRFGSYKTMKDLWQMYHEALAEFKRILKPNGILIVKCQDTISGSIQYFSHVEIINCAVSLGFYPLDLFILLASVRLNNWERQEHARKYHSYFLVFQNIRNPVLYTSSDSNSEAKT